MHASDSEWLWSYDHLLRTIKGKDYGKIWNKITYTLPDEFRRKFNFLKERACNLH
jgi:hypothetical protein